LLKEKAGMFRKIMVPVDGSPTSKRGLEEAIELARDQKASLYLFHVVDELSLVSNSTSVMGGGAYMDGLLKEFVNAGKKILADAEATVRKHRVPVKSLLVENLSTLTSELIVHQARKWKIDLIVLGTHGRRGIRRLVMGSDAEGVVRTTSVPVLLVRAVAPARRSYRKRAPAK
jgi:nucleotide-binding universal stress UspA family protein